MSDIDRIYSLFAEANPAPASVAPTTHERPAADVIFRERRNPTMLTQEPRTIQPAAAPRLRKWRGPTIALASFAGVSLLGVAAWLVMTTDESDVADGTTLPPTATTLPPVATTLPPVATTLPPVATTLPPVVVPGVVLVPDLQGLALTDARVLSSELGLNVVALPNDVGAAIVVAQEPAPGAEVDEGSVVTVDVAITPTCIPPVPDAPGPGEVGVEVLFECGGDGMFPTPRIAGIRIVPEQGGEAIDRIEWTLRSLLAGPTPDERAAGFSSALDEATANALNGVTLTDGRVVVDFNEAIYVNNASTSTGGLFFNAELRANLFHHPEVDSVEFRVNGSCEAWSAFFESDGCWVISRAEWDQINAEWDNLRDQ